eukprot:GHVU01154705.1.p2 GENE.GHVU01154705.1~~GHVU01154705.1.p2  ORF type:complete len:131 (-),score=23.78 GHVU01154705.1:1201-1593(-)
MTWARGDAFDISMALVSLLLGGGYDAYCVCGTAPKSITNGTQNSRIPRLACEDEDEGLTKIKADIRGAEEPRDLVTLEDVDDDEWTPESDDEDVPLHGVHCWVAVKRGKRNVGRDFYIEPSTGRESRRRR